MKRKARQDLCSGIYIARITGDLKSEYASLKLKGWSGGKEPTAFRMRTVHIAGVGVWTQGFLDGDRASLRFYYQLIRNLFEMILVILVCFKQVEPELVENCGS